MASGTDNTFMYMPSVVLATTLPGDANLDGRVDINDLTIVLSNFGTTGMTWSQGDFNDDVKVDINDLTTVLSHFGQSVGSSAAARPPCRNPRQSPSALAHCWACWRRAGENGGSSMLHAQRRES